MERKLMKKLVKWKEKLGRKPLILEGARQVGKTYLLREFGKRYFDNVVYLSFYNADQEILGWFNGSLDPRRLISQISLKFNLDITPHKTLIIFDEVQEVPRALTALKYFNENAPEYCVAAAGSLLGVAMHSEVSFPVGMVDVFYLEPLDFEEFLWAQGLERITEHLHSHPLNPKVSFTTELADAYREYIAVGGMPEAVKTWIQTGSIEAVNQVLEDILNTYTNDFGKHAAPAEVEKIKYVWHSLPSQFAKPNHKFMYGVVKSGARAREYEFAIQWLVDAGLLRKVYLTSSGDKVSLKMYQDLKSFKLYAIDIGVLRVLAELDPAVIIGDDEIFSQSGGAFAEQFVLQQLSAQGKKDMYYWVGGDTSDEGVKSQSEIDFLTTLRGKYIVPIEVKSGKNVYAKSLKVFREKYQPKLAVRFSLVKREYNAGLLNIPLYESFLFTELADSFL
jgi:predicted AAA+ superfamily ATPase